MKEKQNIVNFINHLSRNDFKRANRDLATIVNEKVKQRIIAANKELGATKR